MRRLTMIIEKLEKVQEKLQDKLGDERGALATYGILWLLGVPLSVLVIIWLIRGH